MVYAINAPMPKMAQCPKCLWWSNMPRTHDESCQLKDSTLPSPGLPAPAPHAEVRAPDVIATTFEAKAPAQLAEEISRADSVKLRFDEEVYPLTRTEIDWIVLALRRDAACGGGGIASDQNETSRDWSVCRAVDSYRAPRNEGDERPLSDFLEEQGLRVCAIPSTQSGGGK